MSDVTPRTLKIPQTMHIIALLSALHMNFGLHIRRHDALSTRNPSSDPARGLGMIIKEYKD